MLDDVKLNDWLAKYTGQEIVLIVASLEDERPIPSKREFQQVIDLLS